MEEKWISQERYIDGKWVCGYVRSGLVERVDEWEVGLWIWYVRNAEVERVDEWNVSRESE